MKRKLTAALLALAMTGIGIVGSVILTASPASATVYCPQDKPEPVHETSIKTYHYLVNGTNWTYASGTKHGTTNPNYDHCVCVDMVEDQKNDGFVRLDILWDPTGSPWRTNPGNVDTYETSLYCFNLTGGNPETTPFRIESSYDNDEVTFLNMYY